jgi:hypothetical protein
LRGSWAGQASTMVVSQMSLSSGRRPTRSRVQSPKLVLGPTFDGAQGSGPVYPCDLAAAPTVRRTQGWQSPTARYSDQRSKHALEAQSRPELAPSTQQLPLWDEPCCSLSKCDRAPVGPTARGFFQLAKLARGQPTSVLVILAILSPRQNLSRVIYYASLGVIFASKGFRQGVANYLKRVTVTPSQDLLAAESLTTWNSGNLNRRLGTLSLCFWPTHPGLANGLLQTCRTPATNAPR